MGGLIFSLSFEGPMSGLKSLLLVGGRGGGLLLSWSSGFHTGGGFLFMS